MPVKVIMDVDTGTDDAIALLLAALSPDLDLLGACTVDGNVRVEYCTENTLRVFDCIGADLPVFQGCPAPMVASLTPGRRVGDRYALSEKIHGHYLNIAPAHSRVQEQHAVSWLVETFLKSEGDIILIATGPLTNVGMAMRMEPRILPKIKEIMIMGGGATIHNVNAAAEFNFWVDPEAAKIVMDCGRPIRVVPLDATHQAYISLDDCARLRRLGTAGAINAATIIEDRIHNYDVFRQPMDPPGTVPLHDALAVCAVIEPGVIETVFVNVDIEFGGGTADGESVCDLTFRTEKQPNAHFAIKADRQRFIDLMCEILGKNYQAKR